MKIELTRTVVCSEGNPIAVLSKKYETSLIPVPGMDLHDDMWPDEVEILQVVCDFSNDQYHVVIPDLDVESREAFERIKGILTLHGWSF